MLFWRGHWTIHKQLFCNWKRIPKTILFEAMVLIKQNNTENCIGIFDEQLRYFQNDTAKNYEIISLN